MPCDKCPHCQQLKWKRMVRAFNKKHGPEWEVDDYHMMLFSDEVIEEVSSADNFDTYEAFFEACEEYIKRRK